MMGERKSLKLKQVIKNMAEDIVDRHYQTNDDGNAFIDFDKISEGEKEDLAFLLFEKERLLDFITDGDNYADIADDIATLLADPTPSNQYNLQKRLRKSLAEYYATFMNNLIYDTMIDYEQEYNEARGIDRTVHNPDAERGR